MNRTRLVAVYGCPTSVPAKQLETTRKIDVSSERRYAIESCLTTNQEKQTRRDEAPKDERKKEKGPTPTEPAARGRPGPGVSERETQGQGKRKENGTRGETRRGGDLLHEEHAVGDVGGRRPDFLLRAGGAIDPKPFETGLLPGEDGDLGGGFGHVVPVTDFHIS